jgi:hypothetical protein
MRRVLPSVALQLGADFLRLIHLASLLDLPAFTQRRENDELSRKHEIISTGYIDRFYTAAGNAA